MKSLHGTRARLLALLLLSCWMTLFVPACGLFKLKSQGTKTSQPKCAENEVWMQLFNRCLILHCPVGQFMDRKVCVERCPLGTVPWLLSDAGQRRSYICSSALELRGFIAVIHQAIDRHRQKGSEGGGDTQDAAEPLLDAADKLREQGSENTVSHRVMAHLQASIERAKAALKRLPASMRGCPPPQGSDGEPSCREGATWNEKAELCVFTSCPNQGVSSRGECFERCFPGEHAWEPSPIGGKECVTRLELSDMSAFYEYYLKHPEKRNLTTWASIEERGVRAKAALARIDQSPPEPTHPTGVVLFYGRCQNSPEYDPRLHRDEPPQPGEEVDRRDGPPPPEENDDDPDDGPPPPDEDSHR